MPIGAGRIKGIRGNEWSTDFNADDLVEIFDACTTLRICPTTLKRRLQKRPAFCAMAVCAWWSNLG
jgi:hypothetical protein